MARHAAAQGSRPAQLDAGSLWPVLLADLRAAGRSWPLRTFALIFALGALLGAAHRGPSYLVRVTWIALLGVAVALIAWWCGRHPRAVARADPVRAPRLEAVVLAAGTAGAALWSFGQLLVGAAVLSGTVVAALALVPLAGYRPSDLAPLRRTWLPFLPLLVLVGSPRLVPPWAPTAPAWPILLGGGIVQQVLLQLGLTARLEALTGRRDLAAVGSALLFALLHVALDLPQAGGSWLLAAAGASVFQAPIGLLFAFAYQRHRAPLPLGVIHGLALV